MVSGGWSVKGPAEAGQRLPGSSSGGSEWRRERLRQWEVLNIEGKRQSFSWASLARYDRGRSGPDMAVCWLTQSQSARRSCALTARLGLGAAAVGRRSIPRCSWLLLSEPCWGGRAQQQRPDGGQQRPLEGGGGGGGAGASGPLLQNSVWYASTFRWPGPCARSGTCGRRREA